MHISPEWLHDAPNAAPEERATACDLRIWIGGHNVCFHLDETDGQAHDHVTMRTYALAEGLAHDWWTIFGARDQQYRLIRHRMGYAAPDVRFRFDGAVFEASANQHAYQNPAVRFWTTPPEEMTRRNAEETLAAFVEVVLQKLRDAGVLGTGAELRWERVRASRESSNESGFCEAAGALGADPYDLKEEDAVFIEQSARLFADEALIEFLAGVAGRRFREEMLAWIAEVERRPSYQSRLPRLSPLSREVALATPARAADPGWALGYRRARATRAALGMTAGDRLEEISGLTKRLDNQNFRRGPMVNGLRALISTEGEDVHVHLRDRAPTPEARVSELFAFTRAIGDVVCFPGTARSVVNDLHEADRQAAGRAFAAEFIAPIDEILSMREDGADLTAIAGELNVSSEVIERQLENRERIRAACG